MAISDSATQFGLVTGKVTLGYAAYATVAATVGLICGILSRPRRLVEWTLEQDRLERLAANPETRHLVSLL